MKCVVKKVGRKGISPVVATVLLVIIAIAAGVVAWSVFSRAATTRPVVELSARAEATMSPDGSTCAVDIMLRNAGNVKLEITKLIFEYNGKSKAIAKTVSLAPGETKGWSETLKSTDFGASFVDGETVKLTIEYKDPHGHTYNKTVFATIVSS